MENDKISDLLSETELSVKEAYRRGVADGEKKGAKVPDKAKLIVSNFLSFVNRNYKVTIYEGEIRFKDENYMYSNDNIINNFILSYDDEEV